MGIFRREKKITDTMIAYRSLFDTDDGRIVLNDLIKSCYVLGTTQAETPHETAFNEGQRAVVLRILKTINTDPQKILSLIEEGNQMEAQYVD